MRKRSAEEKQKQLERFLMNVAEAADAALWEYWREKEAEHRRFATEYVTRRGLIPQGQQGKELCRVPGRKDGYQLERQAENRC